MIPAYPPNPTERAQRNGDLVHFMDIRAFALGTPATAARPPADESARATVLGVEACPPSSLPSPVPVDAAEPNDRTQLSCCQSGKMMRQSCARKLLHSGGARRAASQSDSGAGIAALTVVYGEESKEE